MIQITIFSTRIKQPANLKNSKTFTKFILPIFKLDKCMCIRIHKVDD